MTKPRPIVKLTTWSKSMRLKRRYEVVIEDASSEGLDQVALQRFVSVADAHVYMNHVERALGISVTPWATSALLLPSEGEGA